MQQIDHPSGGYRFAGGIAPYSAGVIAQPGYALVRKQFRNLLPLQAAFTAIDRLLTADGRPRQALCAMELRIPAPLSFAGFIEFNAGYRAILESWDILVGDLNPVARTNVAPAVAAPVQPSVYAFTYTVPAPTSPHSFVVAGAGDLRDQAELTDDAIVAPGDNSPTGMDRKARTVLQVMTDRLHALNVDWPDVTTVNLYTVEPPTTYFADPLLTQLGSTAIHGVKWVYSRPPIAGLDFEMDLRHIWRDEMLP
jgi:hypothetical protein